MCELAEECRAVGCVEKGDPGVGSGREQCQLLAAIVAELFTPKCDGLLNDVGIRSERPQIRALLHNPNRDREEILLQRRHPHVLHEARQFWSGTDEAIERQHLVFADQTHRHPGQTRMECQTLTTFRDAHKGKISRGRVGDI